MRSNDRQAWLQSFCPTSEQERNILCTIGNYNHPERIAIQEDTGANVRNTVEQLRGIFDSTPDHALLPKLREDGYVITRAGDRVYCIDFANHAIVDMDAHGFDVSRLISKHDRKPEQKQTSQFKRRLPTGADRALDNEAMQRGGSGDSNREWEVGGQGNDDGRRLKR